MKADRNAPMFAQGNVKVDAAVEEVWSTLTEVDGWPAWQSGVSSAQSEGPLAAGSSFEWKANGFRIQSTIQEIEPTRRIGWTGRALGMNAIHMWTLEPENGGTRVLSQESMSGWLIRLIGMFDREFLKKSLASSLQELKARVEGE